MCHFTDDCDGGEDDYWEDEPTHFGGASIAAFGCVKCGYSDAL
jgi:hypothetical protein